MAPFSKHTERKWEDTKAPEWMSPPSYSFRLNRLSHKREDVSLHRWRWKSFSGLVQYGPAFLFWEKVEVGVCVCASWLWLQGLQRSGLLSCLSCVQSTSTIRWEMGNWRAAERLSLSWKDEEFVRWYIRVRCWISTPVSHLIMPDIHLYAFKSWRDYGKCRCTNSLQMRRCCRGWFRNIHHPYGKCKVGSRCKSMDTPQFMSRKSELVSVF